MKISKCVITAAARNQRTLPLQSLVDRDGNQKTVLNIIVDEAVRAGIEDICVVVCPGDEGTYCQAIGEHSGNLHFVAQQEPLGYGHAVYCAREFIAGQPFLHMVGDHIYVSAGNDANSSGNCAGPGCARELLEVAGAHACSVSGVQPTRENLLPYFGTVGGQRVKGTKDLYLIERVAEKPTPTEAEQSLMIPGSRAGHYLCFFGIHVLTPAVIDILEEHLLAREANAKPSGGIQLSPVLSELANRERYLAYEAQGRRYPIDARYGLLTAQLALALNGRDREEVLANFCELLAQRELSVTSGSRNVMPIEPTMNQQRQEE